MVFHCLAGDASSASICLFLGRKPVELLADLEFLELAQGAQAHVEDGFGLIVGQRPAGHHDLLGLVLLADDADHLVDVEVGDQIAAEDFEALLDLAEPMLRAADQHVLAVLQPFGEHALQREHVRHLAARQHVHVERKARLELGQLEERFHQQAGIDRAALRHQHDADIFRAFVAHVLEQRQLAGQQKLGDLLDQLGLLDLIGNLGDDDVPGAPALVLLHPLGAQTEAAAARLIGFEYRSPAVDHHAAGRKIRPAHLAFEHDRLGALHRVLVLLAQFLLMPPLDIRPLLRRGHQVGDRGIAIVDQVERRRAKFGSVVRRDRRRHADRDARRTVGEDVRKGAGKDDRLLVLLVVGRAEIDRILGDAFEKRGRDVGHARFGVAHGRGVIAVDVAEIALPVDQRIAHGKVLREAHQRVVDRLVAMRMELAHHLADDAGAFGETLVGIEPQQPHGVHDAPVHGLQPVAHIGQRAVHDGRQRIGEIALFERLFQVDRLDVITAAGGRRNKAFSHCAGLAERLIRGKCRMGNAGHASSPSSQRAPGAAIAFSPVFRAFCGLCLFPVQFMGDC